MAHNSSVQRSADPTTFIRRDIRELPSGPASPTLEDLEARLGRPAFKLDTNENPYGPSPLVREALIACRVERYPDAECAALRGTIGDYLEVEPERVVCSAGGDEMIDLLLRLVLEPDDEVINLTPSFVMYPIATIANHGTLVSVPRRPDFLVDVEAVERAITVRTKVIFLCTPNNPTGNLTGRDTIVRLLESGRLVVLDEAYAEFSGVTAVDLVVRYPNLVVLRTMSKWGALAGLRLGYAVVSPEIREEMRKIKSPYNVSVAAQAAGIATLADREYLMGNVRRIVDERERLFRRLSRLPAGRVFPSHTNFLYWSSGELDAETVRDAVARRGVLVRAFPGALRISVGTEDATEGTVAALEAACSEMAEP